MRTILILACLLTACGDGSRATPAYPEDAFAIPNSVVVPKD